MATTRRIPRGNVEVNYTPRDQFLPFHKRTKRWSCIVAHRRAGKTVACVNELVIRALYTTKKRARYGYVAPFRQQAKNIAWAYLKDAVEDFAVEIRESDLSVTLPNGAVIALYGSDNPDSLRGLYFMGIIIDEFADCRPSLWQEVILPTLSDHKGWAVVIGTPKGRNQFYDFYELSKKSKDWFSLTLRADDSGIIDDEELDQLRAQMSESQYEQEMLCSFTAALVGTYWAALIGKIEADGQINETCVHDPEFPVTVTADLGFSDSTVLWFFQERPDGIAIIDCEEGHGESLDYYYRVLRGKPYQYDTIWLPHDAKAKTLQTGKSTIEQFMTEFAADNIKFDIVPHLSIQDGIEAARYMLPYCHFNRARCDLGVEALRTYRRKFDEIKQVYSDAPLHSWESDYADSFRYLAIVAKKRKLKAPAPHESINNEVHPSFTLDQLYAERQRGRGRRIQNMRV